MPTYDFTCSCGEVTEARAGYDVRILPCPACGRQAERTLPGPGHLPLLIGPTVSRPTPTREHPVNVTRFVEAQGELLHHCEKNHIDPPDLYKAAKDRVRRGDVVAIE